MSSSDTESWAVSSSLCDKCATDLEVVAEVEEPLRSSRLVGLFKPANRSRRRTSRMTWERMALRALASLIRFDCKSSLWSMNVNDGLSGWANPSGWGFKPSIGPETESDIKNDLRTLGVQMGLLGNEPSFWDQRYLIWDPPAPYDAPFLQRLPPCGCPVRRLKLVCSYQSSGLRVMRRDSSTRPNETASG